MTSVTAGHIILIPTQPVGNWRPQREWKPQPPDQESRALPLSYRIPRMGANMTKTESNSPFWYRNLSLGLWSHRVQLTSIQTLNLVSHCCSLFLQLNYVLHNLHDTTGLKEGIIKTFFFQNIKVSISHIKRKWEKKPPLAPTYNGKIMQHT